MEPEVSAVTADPETTAPEQDLPEQAEGNESADAPEGDAPDDAKKSAAKERRDREKALKTRLREEREAAILRAETAERRLAELTQSGQQDKEPREADYRDIAEYDTARAIWLYGQAQRNAEAAKAQTEAATAKQNAEALAGQEEKFYHDRWHGQDKADGQARYADFDAVIGPAPISNGVSALIMRSPNAADVAYHIASNHALCRELNQMGSIEAAIEIGQIAARVAQRRAKPETRAPAPVSPVKGGGIATKDPTRMTPAEWRAAREAGWKP